MKIRKISVWTEINFVLGKNGGHRPISLGGRLIVVRQAGRQADEMLAVYKFYYFNSKGHLGCLNGFMAPKLRTNR